MIHSSLRLEPLSEKHLLDQFDCYHIPEMNDWFRGSALNAHNGRSSRVFVLTGDDDRPVGFFTLSGLCLEVGSLSSNDGKRYRTNTVPAHFLGRIAVDKSLKGEGVGPFLIAAAFKKYAQILELSTSNFLFLSAHNDFLAGYYEGYGFKRSPGPVTPGDPIPMYMKSSAILKYLAASQ